MSDIRRVRRMEECDIDAVFAIEKENFSIPWTEEGFMQAILREENIFLVCELEGEIIGYCGAYVVCGEADITNVSVKSDYQNQKIGFMMLQKMLELLEKKHIHEVTLEVRVSNAAAIHLYEKLGFVCEGIRPRFYDAPIEDAAIMWKR